MFGGSEKKLWREAHTLVDLGELTARWLEGRIRWNPSYPGNGPDPETRQVARELAAANRAGYVTHQSQPGVLAGRVRQRATVEGFAEPQTARRLQQMAKQQGLEVVVHTSVPRRRCDTSRTIPVTDRGDGRLGAFGVNLSTRELTDYAHTAELWDALHNAHQVTIVDPEWGRNTVLWRLLVRFARH